MELPMSELYEQNPIMVFVKSGNRATVICPDCGTTKTTFFSRELWQGRVLKVCCACGETFYIKPRFSRTYSRETALSGSCMNLSEDSEQNCITVRTVSQSCIEFFTSAHHTIRKGHKLLIEFSLESGALNKIYRKAVVSLVRGKLISCSFIENHDQGGALDNFLIA